MTRQITSAGDRLDESIARLVAFANEPAQSAIAEVPEDILSLIERHSGPLTACAYDQLAKPEAQRRLLYAQHIVSERKMEKQRSGTRVQKAFATFKWACGLDVPPAHKSLGDAENDRFSIRFMAVMTLIPVGALALMIITAVMKHQ